MKPNIKLLIVNHVISNEIMRLDIKRKPYHNHYLSVYHILVLLYKRFYFDNTRS